MSAAIPCPAASQSAWPNRMSPSCADVSEACLVYWMLLLWAPDTTSILLHRCFWLFGRCQLDPAAKSCFQHSFSSAYDSNTLRTDSDSSAIQQISCTANLCSFCCDALGNHDQNFFWSKSYLQSGDCSENQKLLGFLKTSWKAKSLKTSWKAKSQSSLLATLLCFAKSLQKRSQVQEGCKILQVVSSSHAVNLNSKRNSRNRETWSWRTLSQHVKWLLLEWTWHSL